MHEWGIDFQARAMCGHDPHPEEVVLGMASRAEPLLDVSVHDDRWRRASVLEEKRTQTDHSIMR